MQVMDFYFGEEWLFGPDLPEPLCCAAHFSYNGELHVIGGSTPTGGFLVKA